MPDCLLQNGHTYRSKDGHLCQPQHLSAQVHTIASKSAAMRATSMLRHLTSSIFFLAAYCLLLRRPAVWYKQSCSSSRHQRLSARHTSGKFTAQIHLVYKQHGCEHVSRSLCLPYRWRSCRGTQISTPLMSWLPSQLPWKLLCRCCYRRCAYNILHHCVTECRALLYKAWHLLCN